MQSHEYRVLPAPRRGLRAKGARRAEDRFALAVEAEMNRMAAEGWEFVRSDTLPSERRQGWFSRPATVFETVLVFRRPHAAAPRAPAAAMPPAVGLAPAAVAAPLGPAASALPPGAVAPLGPAAPAAAEPAPGHPAPVAPAPAASRFTPPPAPPKPANTTAPVAMPPPPSLTLVREGPAPHDPPAEPAADADPRRAAD